jgi:hypothetical protein
MKAEFLNVKSKYKSYINSSSMEDIVSGVIICVECVLASSIVLVNLLK